MSAVTVQESRTIALAVGEAFDGTLPFDLTALFVKRHGPIPPIVEIRDEVGPWATAGQTRTLVLADGGTMNETLTEVDEPRSFSYRLTASKGPFGLLMDHVDGRWQFDAAGSDTTNVTWRWTIHPRSAVLTPVVRVFGVIWKGMARKALLRLDTHLVARG